MAELYTSGTAFTTPTTIRAWVEYPFRDQGDSSTKVYHHIMQVKSASYATLANDDTMTAADEKPARSPFADDSSAYYVGDYSLTHIGDGLVQFDRQFAHIPADRIEPNGFYPFEFPDVPLGIKFEATTTSESASYNSSTFDLTLTATVSASDADNINDGDFIYIYNASGFEFNNGTYGTIKYTIGGFASKSGTTFTIVTSEYYFLAGVKTAWSTFTDNTPTDYTVKKIISPDRNAVGQLNSPSIISFRYVKTSNPDSISLNKKYIPANGAGTVITTLTSGSTPFDVSRYREAGLLGEYIINAEDETLSRWKGNIYQISQIRVQPR